MTRYTRMNPPNSKEYEWVCRLCHRNCDMSETFSPPFYYWCPLSRVLLCPAHALGGASAQSQEFVKEIEIVLLDLLQCYQAITQEKLAQIWKILFKTKDFISSSDELVRLCEEIVQQAIALVSGNEVTDGNMSTRSEEATTHGFLAMTKHIRQCGDWIFGDTKRSQRLSLTQEQFVKTNRFRDIILAYYWEYDETEYADRVHNEETFDLWKYIEYWLKSMDMTVDKLHHEVIEEGNEIYIWRVQCFLKGISESYAILEKLHHFDDVIDGFLNADFSLDDEMYEDNEDDDDNGTGGNNLGAGLYSVDEDESKHEITSSPSQRMYGSPRLSMTLASQMQEIDNDSFISRLMTSLKNKKLKEAFLKTKRSELPVGMLLTAQVLSIVSYVFMFVLLYFFVFSFPLLLFFLCFLFLFVL